MANTSHCLLVTVKLEVTDGWAIVEIVVQVLVGANFTQQNGVKHSYPKISCIFCGGREGRYEVSNFQGVQIFLIVECNSSIQSVNVSEVFNENNK